MENNQPIIIYNDHATEFAQAIGGYLGKPLYEVEKTSFTNGEIKVKIPVNVREHTVFYIHTFQDGEPMSSYLELFMVNDALKRAAAEKIIDVLPFMPFTRADRKDEARVSITAKLMADLADTSGANRVITADLHSGQIQGFYNIPVDNLYVDMLIAEHIKENKYPVDNMVIGSPDAGSIKRSRSVAEHLGGLELVILDKRRPVDENGKPIPNLPKVHNVVGEVKGKYVLFFEDMIDTGGTLVESAVAVKKQGALGVFAGATHGLFSPKDGVTAEEKLFAEIDRIIVTNTLTQTYHPNKEVVNVAKLFADAIKIISERGSLSELF